MSLENRSIIQKVCANRIYVEQLSIWITRRIFKCYELRRNLYAYN